MAVRGLNIAAIVAADEGDAIGVEGRLPWRLSSDLKRFRSLTSGSAVVMGRKTFESIGKVLPDRLNIVVTRSSTWAAPAPALTVHSFEDAIEAARAGGLANLFVIGGADLYRASREHWNELLLTRVHGRAERADAHFSIGGDSSFTCVAREALPAGERDEFATTYERWVRAPRG